MIEANGLFISITDINNIISYLILKKYIFKYET